MKHAQVFTPAFIVRRMLDMVPYTPAKTVFEPSFGSGNFLVEIVSRILQMGDPTLLDNVYGCEIDSALYAEAIARLNALLREYGLTYDWHNLICCDALDYPPMQFDIVIGNPPYVRIHDMDDSERAKLGTMAFSQGMKELYVAFFELGLDHLKPDGHLVYITPNSYLKNTSQKAFRDYIGPMLTDIVDYGPVQVFEEALTYTCITHLHKNHHGMCRYVKMSDKENAEYTADVDILHDGYIFTSSSDKAFLDKLDTIGSKLGDICDVRYGIATNADKIYINPKGVEPGVVRPIVKASTLQRQTILYPYIRDTEVIPEEIMRAEYPAAFRYITANAAVLAKRDMDGSGPFYRYARTQGLRDVDKPKLALKHIVPAGGLTCEALKLDAQTLVYSGLMLIPKEGYYDTVYDIITSPDFCRYVKLLGKDMSGGYISFTAKTVSGFPCHN